MCSGTREPNRRSSWLELTRFRGHPDTARRRCSNGKNKFCSGPGIFHASRGTKVEMNARWLRHAALLPAVIFGAWYGVDQGSRGAFLLAGGGAVAWFIWPEASRFLAWRRRRRTETARSRLERALRRAYRDVAKAERARQRADRRPSSARHARRAARMEARAERALATAARSRDRATAIGDDPSPP